MSVSTAAASASSDSGTRSRSARKSAGSVTSGPPGTWRGARASVRTTHRGRRRDRVHELVQLLRRAQPGQQPLVEEARHRALAQRSRYPSSTARRGRSASASKIVRARPAVLGHADDVVDGLDQRRDVDGGSVGGRARRRPSAGCPRNRSPPADRRHAAPARGGGRRGSRYRASARRHRVDQLARSPPGMRAARREPRGGRWPAPRRAPLASRARQRSRSIAASTDLDRFGKHVRRGCQRDVQVGRRAPRPRRALRSRVALDVPSRRRRASTCSKNHSQPSRPRRCARRRALRRTRRPAATAQERRHRREPDRREVGERWSMPRCGAAPAV